MLTPSGGRRQGDNGRGPKQGRYRQYTRNDIMAAIEDVKNGRPTLEAAKKYRVPARTLYAKLKKFGITAGTLSQEETNTHPSSDADHRDGIPSTKDPIQHHLALEGVIHNARSALDEYDTLSRHTCAFCGLHVRNSHSEEAANVTVGRFSCSKCNEKFHMSREIAMALRLNPG